MPTYQYECDSCGKSFEIFQSMKDPALTTCPKDLCAKKKWGRGKVRRQLGTGAGIIFKGSGFYITDYRSENYKSAAKKEKDSSSPAPATTTSSSSDAKSPAPAPATPAAAPAKPKPTSSAKA